jgi:peptidyl-Asp metalloendopeptidase
MTMRGRILVLLSGLLLSTLPVAESWAATAPQPLFDAPAGVRDASSGIPSRAGVRQRRVAPRLGLLTRSDGSPALRAGDRIQLNLFDDARFAMTIGEVTRHSDRGSTWSGTLDGIDHSSAVLVVQDGVLVGQVSTPHDVYRIGYAPDGAPVVEQMDPGALGRESPPIIPPPAATADRPSTNVGAEIPDVASDTASQIDVMVLYTPAARAVAGGAAAMRAEVDLFIGLANQAYAHTDLVQRLRLVYAGEIAITETTADQDLTNLRANPTVARLRSLVRADVVSLLTDHGPTSTFCGIGYLMVTNSTGFAPNAFSVVERDCATTIQTFTHELGHNMGGHHDLFVATGDSTMFAYSHGYVDLVGKFRTIMAYPDQCSAAGISCPRVVAFSSPLFTAGGRPIGTAVTSDNSRTLSQTGNTVANFNTALVGPPSVSTGVNKSVFAAGDTLVLSVGLENSGRTGNADIYFGLLAPDNTVVFFTGTVITPTSGFALGTFLDFASYRPIATGVPLAAPFSVNIPSFVSYRWGGGEAKGGYALLLLAVTAGALGDGNLTTNEVIAVSVTPFSFL